MSDTTITHMPAAPGPSLIPQAPAPTPRPDYIPEKFWDSAKGAPKLEDLAKSYSSLEKKLGSNTPSTSPTPAPEPQPAPQAPAGIDMDSLTNEFSTTGSLSEATLKGLESRGIPKALVDSYIKGIQAQSQIVLDGVFSSKEEVAQFKEWAGKSLSPEEQTAFNTLVQSGDTSALQLALQGLKAKFIEASPQDPNLLGGDASSSPGPGYKTWAHVTTAMNDKRYHTDPAYREQVEKTIKLSIQQGLLQ
jgi:hypothetical protein